MHMYMQLLANLIGKQDVLVFHKNGFNSIVELGVADTGTVQPWK